MAECHGAIRPGERDDHASARIACGVPMSICSLNNRNDMPRSLRSVRIEIRRGKERLRRSNFQTISVSPAFRYSRQAFKLRDPRERPTPCRRRDAYCRRPQRSAPRAGDRPIAGRWWKIRARSQLACRKPPISLLAGSSIFRQGFSDAMGFGAFGRRASYSALRWVVA